MFVNVLVCAAACGLDDRAALALVREMPVLAAARLMGITGTRLWRIVRYYVDQAIARFDFSAVRAIGPDETALKRGHHYVTVFIDMARRKESVLFVTPGHGKERCAVTVHSRPSTAVAEKRLPYRAGGPLSVPGAQDTFALALALGFTLVGAGRDPSAAGYPRTGPSIVAA